MAGRTALLDDDERRAKVLKALEDGGPRRRAAQAGGVHPDTLREYLLACRGDDVDDIKAGFPAAVQEAEAKGFMVKLGKAQKIADDEDNPNAAIRSLEMMFRMTGDLKGPGGPSVAVDFDDDGRVKRVRASSDEVAGMTDEELAGAMGEKE